MIYGRRKGSLQDIIRISTAAGFLVKGAWSRIFGNQQGRYGRIGGKCPYADVK